MPDDDVLAQLTGPGGPFEIVQQEVLGVPLQVYANRLGSLRDVVALAEGRGEADFLVQGDRRLTFAEHNARARAVAARLAELGLQRGDRVTILSANSIEWVMTFWACAAAGFVAVPLNAWWKTEELAFALRDSGTRAMVCDQRRWDVVRELVGTLEDLEHVFVVGLDAPDGPARPGAELFDAPAVDAFAGDAPAEDDLLAILYTSGTTGTPKGATVTHRQAVANLQNLAVGATAIAMRARARGEEPSGVPSAALLVVPLFHVTGCLATMVTSYASGSKLVLMPPGRFEPDRAMQVIEAEQVTSIGGVPTVMWRIVEAPTFGDYDLSSVTRISYGGAPAAPELVSRIKEAFPQVRDSLGTAYGLTETASVATAISGDDYLSHPGSCGRAVPTVELRVVTDDGGDAPVGTAGEVWLRGPTIMLRGYWNRPDATADVLTPDGWFRTGDIGKLDDEGFLYLVDRAKDMIIRAGENVYCVEVEHVLHEHPDVLDAAVVGVPHKELGEEVKAVVQLRAGSTADAEALRAHCRQHLADFKVPEYVELRDEPLPRNPAGKILKQVLRGDGSSFAAAADDSAL